MQRRLVALIGQRGVCARHVLNAQAVVAKYGVRFGSIQRRVLHTRLACGIGDFLGAQLGLQIHVHGVRRLFGSRIQVHVSQVRVAVVAHGFGDAGEGAERVAVEHRVQAYAFVYGGQ